MRNLIIAGTIKILVQDFGFKATRGEATRERGSRVSACQIVAESLPPGHSRSEVTVNKIWQTFSRQAMARVAGKGQGRRAKAIGKDLPPNSSDPPPINSNASQPQIARMKSARLSSARPRTISTWRQEKGYELGKRKGASGFMPILKYDARIGEFSLQDRVQKDGGWANVQTPLAELTSDLRSREGRTRVDSFPERCRAGNGDGAGRRRSR